MRIKTLAATAGLALALTLAATGAAGKGADAGTVVGAQADRTSPVTAALGPVGGHRYSRSPYANQARVIWVPVPLAPEPPPTPEPAVAPAPPRPAPAAPGSIGAVIERHFGAGAARATAIARCESGLNPSAVSPTNDHGLFQINIVHRGQFEAVTGAPWSAVYDVELNTRYAKWLHGQQGWGPWVCSRKV